MSIISIFENEHDNFEKIKLTNILIKYFRTLTRILSLASGLGEHNSEILIEILNYSTQKIDDLVKYGVLYSES